MTMWFIPPNAGAYPPDQSNDAYGGYSPSQPSQKYPFRPVVPPRVDNKNQPWYGGKRGWGQGPDVVQNADALVSQTSGLSTDPGTTNYNLSSIWSQFANWFGGMTPKQNLKDISGTPVDRNQVVDQSTVSSNPSGFYVGSDNYSMGDY